MSIHYFSGQYFSNTFGSMDDLLVKDVHIREYRQADQAAILYLLRLNTPTYFAQEEEESLIHYLDHDIAEYFVMEMNGAVVGSGGINFSPDKETGIISWDIIHPDFHGKGLGSKLLQLRIKRLFSHYDVASIIVRTSQLAHRFYERSGFREIEVVKDYWAEGYDLHKMVMAKDHRP